ncbi:helix-turn-helix domain-containing protein [Morganella morganii]
MMKKKNQMKIPDQNTGSECCNLEQYVGTVISARRKGMGLSGKELGERVGLSQQQISRYERGVTSITLSNLESLSVALGMSFRQFIDELFLYAEISKKWTAADSNMLPYLHYPEDILVDTIAAEVSGLALFFNQNQ